MKSLLNMAAFTAIQFDPELKMYYLNRVEKGKSKMSTINIVRNKIVHRVFAVVKRGTPYVSFTKTCSLKNINFLLVFVLEYGSIAEGIHSNLCSIPMNTFPVFSKGHVSL